MITISISNPHCVLISPQVCWQPLFALIKTAHSPLGCADGECIEMLAASIGMAAMGVAFLHIGLAYKRAALFTLCVCAFCACCDVYCALAFKMPQMYIFAAAQGAVALAATLEWFCGDDTPSSSRKRRGPKGD